MQTSNTVKKIYEKLKQNQFKCALSGIELSPDNFCIDHVKPLADGGTNHVDNLQCVHPVVNKMKGTMSNQQFVDMCKKVAKNSATLSPPY